MNVNGRKLNWFHGILFKWLMKYFDGGGHAEIQRLIDHEVVRRRNQLHRENPNINPLSPEYPDIDTIRKEWGLPTTSDMIVDMADKLAAWAKK